MGILDRLAGSPKDRFARRVLATVRAAGVADARYDRDTFAISVSRTPGTELTGHIYLGNVFRDCRGASRPERDERIVALVRSVLNTGSLPESWDAARLMLRPVLRRATFSLGINPRTRPAVRRPALPHLHEMIVFDTPTAMAYVTADRLAAWNVTASDAFGTARANLAAMSVVPPARHTSPAPIIRLVDDGNGYFVARLLLDGWLASLAPHVGGRPVAFVPDTNTVLVVADASEGLAKLMEVVEQEYHEAARPISPQPYTVDDAGTVIPYAVPSDHPLSGPVSRAAAILAADEYTAQGRWLDAEHKRDGIDVYVATLMAAGRPDGSVFTVATWSRGLDTLLPEAQYVAMGERGQQPFIVPWSTVTREVDLEPVPDLDPVRYRLRGWPPEAVVERLRAAAVNP